VCTLREGVMTCMKSNFLPISVTPNTNTNQTVEQIPHELGH